MGQKGTQTIENQSESASLTPKQGASASISSQNQLATPEMTPQHITTSPPYQTRYTGDGRARFGPVEIQHHDQAPIDNVVVVQDDSLTNTNVIQRCKRKKKQDRPELTQLPPTGTGPLDVKGRIPSLADLGSHKYHNYHTVVRVLYNNLNSANQICTIAPHRNL